MVHCHNVLQSVELYVRTQPLDKLSLIIHKWEIWSAHILQHNDTLCLKNSREYVFNYYSNFSLLLCILSPVQSIREHGFSTILDLANFLVRTRELFCVSSTVASTSSSLHLLENGRAALSELASQAHYQGGSNNRNDDTWFLFFQVCQPSKSPVQTNNE